MQILRAAVPGTGAPCRFEANQADQVESGFLTQACLASVPVRGFDAASASNCGWALLLTIGVEGGDKDAFMAQNSYCHGRAVVDRSCCHNPRMTHSTGSDGQASQVSNTWALATLPVQ